jgi:Tfp pilus assembly protein PilO
MLTRKKIKFYVILISVTVLVGAVILAGQSYLNYLAAKSQASNAQQQLSAVEVEILDIKNSIAQYEVEKAEFEKLLFSEQDIPAFLDGISKFAGELEMKIADMKTKQFSAVRPPVDNTRAAGMIKRDANETKPNPQQELKRILTLAAMPIHIKMEGTYPAFVQLLAKLENFDQFLTISDVHIASNKTYPDLNCDFILKLYSFKTLEELEAK